MKNISTPYPGFYQVRICRNKVKYNKDFNSKGYPSVEATLQAAIAWRDKILDSVGLVNRKLGGHERNQSTGINGVSSRIKTNDSKMYLIFRAHYRDANRKPKYKEFSAGNIESLTEKKAIQVFTITLLFRKEFERARLSGGEITFSEDEFKNYKQLKDSEITRRLDSLGIGRESLNRYIETYQHYNNG